MAHEEVRWKGVHSEAYVLGKNLYASWETYTEPCILLNIASMSLVFVFEALSSSWRQYWYIICSLEHEVAWGGCSYHSISHEIIHKFGQCASNFGHDWRSTNFKAFIEPYTLKGVACLVGHIKAQQLASICRMMVSLPCNLRFCAHHLIGPGGWYNCVASR